MSFRQKHLLGLQDLDAHEIIYILDTAASFEEILTREIKKVPTLRGKTVVTFFYEPSTRTRTSFELAAKHLSADTASLSGSTSSMVKGETLIDTVRNLEAMKPDLLIVRHPCAGAPHLIARSVSVPVINAGDGMHEHPTQALLDLYTVRKRKGKIEGLTLLISGDIAHSRVARSNILGFTKLGARVILAAPLTLIPRHVEKYGVEVFTNLDEAIPHADVIMMLRIQRERLAETLFPSLREYAMRYGLNRDRLSKAKEDVLVMHPGPINRGVEMSPDVADGPYSVILEQVTNGVVIRMALLYLLLTGESRGASFQAGSSHRS